MVATTSSLLNSLLADNFSEIGRNKSLFSSLQQQFALPTAVTPADGSDASGFGDSKDSNEGSQQQLPYYPNRPQTFRDLAKPQISLLPSDEASLFAVARVEAQPKAYVPQLITQSSDLSDEINRARRQALATDDRDALSETLQQRGQQAVATLYARNYHAVYNVTPLFSEAA